MRRFWGVAVLIAALAAVGFFSRDITAMVKNRLSADTPLQGIVGTVSRQPEVIVPEESPAGNTGIPPANDVQTAVTRPNEAGDRVPILMYHQVATPKGPWKQLFVTPQDFAGQLDWLRDNGYHTILLQDLYVHWKNNSPLPVKPVVLTFDDGYRSMYETVLPLLRERGMKATFFLYPKGLNTSGGLTTAMVGELAQNGMEIGSHTYNHVELNKIPAARFKTELADSKEYLERIIGHRVDFLCYPVGRYNDQVISAVREYGYLAAVTTNYGKADGGQDSYQWPRLRIAYKDGIKGFIKKITE